MKYSTSCLVLYVSALFCSANGRVSLTVFPRRSQFFIGESLSLSCEDYGFSGGTIWRKTEGGNVTTCGDYWGKLINTFCLNEFTIPEDSGVYWCQSEHRENSTVVNITVNRDQVILESPALPVMEGGPVTLRCSVKAAPQNLTAGFYRNGSLISSGSTGEMRIPAVSASDEGLYRCTIPGLGESPHSWLAVQRRPEEDPPSSSGMSAARLVCHLVVMAPYVVSTILLGLVYRDQARDQLDKEKKKQDSDDVLMKIEIVERQKL